MEIAKHRNTAWIHAAVASHVCGEVHEPKHEDHPHHQLMRSQNLSHQIGEGPTAAAAARPKAARRARKAMTNRMSRAPTRLMEGQRLRTVGGWVLLAAAVGRMVVMEAPMLLGGLVSRRARFVNSPPVVGERKYERRSRRRGHGGGPGPRNRR